MSQTFTVIQYPALPAVITRTNGRGIDCLVMHSTGGVKGGDLFTLRGLDRTHPVSCHYYITKAAEIYQLVQDQDIAHHAGVSALAGRRDVNSFSIGVELEHTHKPGDRYTSTQLEAAIWLARRIVQRYGIPRSRLVAHGDIALPKGRRSDPVNFPWESFVSQVYAPAPVAGGDGGALGDGYRIYRCIAQTELRTSPDRSGQVVETIKRGDLYPAQAIRFGQIINGRNGWLHRSDSRGFAHESAFEPV